MIRLSSFSLCEKPLTVAARPATSLLQWSSRNEELEIIWLSSAKNEHFLPLLMIPITPIFVPSFRLLLPSPSCFQSPLTILTVSLSGSVVETCHSGLPKGRTSVLPFPLCAKRMKSIWLKNVLRVSAGTELTQRLAEQKKTLSGYICMHTVTNRITVIRFGLAGFSHV